MLQYIELKEFIHKKQLNVSVFHGHKSNIKTCFTNCKCKKPITDFVLLNVCYKNIPCMNF